MGGGGEGEYVRESFFIHHMLRYPSEKRLHNTSYTNWDLDPEFLDNSRIFFHYFSKNYPKSSSLLYIGNSCIISHGDSDRSITSAL